MSKHRIPTARIIAALSECSTMTGAARALGVSRRTIYKRARTEPAVQAALANLRERKRWTSNMKRVQRYACAATPFSSPAPNTNGAHPKE